jgi:hypothetical protein
MWGAWGAGLVINCTRLTGLFNADNDASGEGRACSSGPLETGNSIHLLLEDFFLSYLPLFDIRANMYNYWINTLKP